jgi:hypothetical protein
VRWPELWVQKEKDGRREESSQQPFSPVSRPSEQR